LKKTLDKLPGWSYTIITKGKETPQTRKEKMMKKTYTLFMRNVAIQVTAKELSAVIREEAKLGRHIEKSNLGKNCFMVCYWE